MMRNQLQNTMMQYKRYDNIDGTGEMLMGLMLMGFALLGYLQTVLPEHSMWRTNFFAHLLFMYAVLILVLGAGYWLRRVIKQRITFPRTGYVAGHSLWRMMFPPKPDKNVVAPGAAARRAFGVAVLSLTLVTAVVAAGFGYIMVRQLHGAPGFARVSYLAFWVPIYAFWVFRMGREHLWKWIVLLFMALGLVVIGLIVPGGFVELSRWVTLFVGLLWFVSGGATLCSYLRHTHPPASVTE